MQRYYGGEFKNTVTVDDADLPRPSPTATPTASE
jgi:hypothetical protein